MRFSDCPEYRSVHTYPVHHLPERGIWATLVPPAVPGSTSTLAREVCRLGLGQRLTGWSELSGRVVVHYLDDDTKHATTTIPRGQYMVVWPGTVHVCEPLALPRFLRTFDPTFPLPS